MKFFLRTLILFILGLGTLACKQELPKGVYRFSGTLELTEHMVGFPVPGRLETLNVDEGDSVEMGQLLAQLDNYPLAKREYQRLVQLLNSGGTNQQAVEEAEQQMLDRQALAPVSGVVLSKIHETGETLGATSPLLILGDLSEVWVRIYVPEGMVNRIALGQEARVRLDGLDREFPGKVRYVSTQAEFTPRNVQTPEERVMQTFAVKIYLDPVPDQVRAGVPADVFLDLPE